MFEPGHAIKVNLCQRGVTQKWLIERLSEKDVRTDKYELSNVLAGRINTPKALMILTVSQEILRNG